MVHFGKTGFYLILYRILRPLKNLLTTKYDPMLSGLYIHCWGLPVHEHIVYVQGFHPALITARLSFVEASNFRYEKIAMP